MKTGNFEYEPDGDTVRDVALFTLQLQLTPRSSWQCTTTTVSILEQTWQNVSG